MCLSPACAVRAAQPSALGGATRAKKNHAAMRSCKDAASQHRLTSLCVTLYSCMRNMLQHCFNTAITPTQAKWSTLLLLMAAVPSVSAPRQHLLAGQLGARHWRAQCCAHGTLRRRPPRKGSGAKHKNLHCTQMRRRHPCQNRNEQCCRGLESSMHSSGAEWVATTLSRGSELQVPSSTQDRHAQLCLETRRRGPPGSDRNPAHMTLGRNPAHTKRLAPSCQAHARQVVGHKMSTQTKHYRAATALVLSVSFTARPMRMLHLDNQHSGCGAFCAAPLAQAVLAACMCVGTGQVGLGHITRAAASSSGLC